MEDDTSFDFFNLPNTLQYMQQQQPPPQQPQVSPHSSTQQVHLQQRLIQPLQRQENKTPQYIQPMQQPQQNVLPVPVNSNVNQTQRPPVSVPILLPQGLTSTIDASPLTFTQPLPQQSQNVKIAPSSVVPTLKPQPLPQHQPQFKVQLPQQQPQVKKQASVQPQVKKPTPIQQKPLPNQLVLQPIPNGDKMAQVVVQAQLLKTEPQTTLMYTASTPATTVGTRACQPVFVDAAGGTILATGNFIHLTPQTIALNQTF